MEASINMICELKITSGSKKNCVKIPWWSDIPLKSYQRETVLRGHEIHSRHTFPIVTATAVAVSKVASCDSSLNYSQSILKRQIEWEFLKLLRFKRSHVLAFTFCCNIYTFAKNMFEMSFLVCQISCVHFSSVPHDHGRLIPHMMPSWRNLHVTMPY